MLCGIRCDYSMAEASTEKNGGPLGGFQSFELAPSEQEKLMVAAEKGDAQAAFRLSQYYGIAKNDLDMQLVWLRRAAELGHPSGQYNLGYLLVYDPRLRNLDEADRWLKKAAVTARAQRDRKLQQMIRAVQKKLRQVRAGEAAKNK